jgi:gliding motility-associated-like protein
MLIIILLGFPWHIFELVAQTLSDGPIQLQVRVRRINTTFNATDQGAFGIGFIPDELTYFLWARDNPDVDGAGWLGGNCLTANFNPPNLSPDFNYLMFNHTYPTATVPRYFDIRLDAWEDDINSDQVLGFCSSGTRCTFQGNTCCGFFLFGACVGVIESDDHRCNANPFRNGLDYRLGPPCQWYNHGFVTYAGSGCSSNNYQPEIESFWRYTRGTSCANAIDLGALTSGPGLSHYNSNVCYSNNFSASPGNDVFYRFTVASQTRVIASLCGASGAQFDSYLYLLDSNCNVIASDNDGCGNQSVITRKLCNPGTYYLVVDGNTVNAQGTFTLTVQQDPSFSYTANISRSNVTCNGANNGSATASATGGAAPYSFAWSNGATTTTISNLAPGTYTVTITDADGCSVTTSATITQPAVLTATISKTDVTCSGANDGTATVSPSGGTAPYSYTWNTVPVQTTATAIFLSDGNYTVTVRDANNCTITRSVNIGTNSVINVSLNNLQHVRCFGQNNGSITLNVSGGFAPYTYTWSHGATTRDVTNLGPGNYTITVRDNSNCSVTRSYTINEPPALIAAITDIFNVSCHGDNDGSITIGVNGGVQPYSYIWSNGATTQNLINVNAGNYSVTVRDANNCTVSVSGTISQPAALTANISAVNPTCHGSQNGSILLSVTGGTAPYNFLWSNAATTQNLNALGAGNYMVLITDLNGCFLSRSITLSAPPSLAAQSILSHVNCNGTPSGSIQVTPSGATPPYRFNWSNGATSPGIYSLAAGNYLLTLSDANNCSLTQLYTITEPPPLAVAIARTVNVSCYAASDGLVEIQVSGGTPPYNFLWSNGATSQNLVNVGGGTYSVTVSDANNCISLVSASISEPSALMVSAVFTPPTCNGFTNGSVTTTVTGGNPPYSYTWSHGATTQNLVNISSGSYSLIVTDTKGCWANTMVIVNEPAALNITEIITHLRCNGDNSGNIHVMVSGGTPGYAYNWSNGSTTQNLNHIAAGSYQLTVSDMNNCSTTGNFTVNEPAPLNLYVSNIQHVSCFGFSDGSVAVHVGGGTVPYSFSWSNAATTQNLFNIPAGNYTLQVSDFNNCTASLNALVTQPDALIISLSVTDPSCHGQTNGSIDAYVIGGTVPYRFSWSNGATSEDITGLGAGTYTLVVNDRQNCTAQRSATLIAPQPLSVMAVINDVTCHGNRSGSISIHVTGGTTPYDFNWSNNATTQHLFNISGGIYTLTITDAAGCTAVYSYNVYEPDLLVVSIAQQDNVSCHGFSDATIVPAVSGGVPPFNYLWSNHATTAVLTNIAAANYSLTVTDANQCTATITTTVTEPAILQVTLNVHHATCTGSTDGYIQSVVNGGTAPYIFNWSNGATTPNITSLPAGTYTLVVTDANNCVAQQTATVIAPPQLTLLLSKTDLNCFGSNNGTAMVNVSGGTAPYHYLWSNNVTSQTITHLTQGAYSVTVTDANQCTISGSITLNQPPQLNITVDDIIDVSCSGYSDGSVMLTAGGGTPPYLYSWNDGVTTINRSRLTAGNYILTLTDANGCSLDLAVTINEPQPLSVFLQTTNVSCHGATDGQITAMVSGGTAPYHYLWSNNATSSSIGHIPAGNYSVLVSDLNNCYRMVTSSVSEPSMLNIQALITHAACGGNSGSIDLTISGGTQPYYYLWSNGSTTEDLQHATPGNYSLSLTDANGCTTTSSYNVTQSPAVNIAVVQSKDVSCNGAADGFIETTVLSGTPPFVYSWYGTISSTPYAFNLTSGVYTLIVNDAANCADTVFVTIHEPAPLSVTFNSVHPSCTNISDGSIIAQVSGGITPYRFQWSNNATTSVISNLTEGSYTVLITDDNGCFIYATEQLTSASSVQITVQIIDVKCAGDNTGAIFTSITGGTSPFFYQWSNGSNTADLTNIAAGNYHLTVTDARGCSGLISAAVSEPLPVDLRVHTMGNRCHGLQEGVAFAITTGGIPPYNYTWSNQAAGNTETAGSLASGNYTVTVTDAHYCSASASFFIAEPPPLTIQLVSKTDASCDGFPDGSVSFSASGGNPPYLFSVTNNQFQSSETFSQLYAGHYVAIINDANGCTAALPFEISAPAPFSVNLPTSVVIFRESSYTIKPTLTGIDESEAMYAWSPSDYLSCTQCPQPIASPFTDTRYTVTVTDATGCSDTASIYILVKEDYEIFTPNIFSPNGDGVNDYFVPLDFGAAKNLEVSIFNRWGELIFRTDKLQHGWDGTYRGKDCEVGVYTYFIKGEFLNGVSFKKTGSVTLIRDKP